MTETELCGARVRWSDASHGHMGRFGNEGGDGHGRRREFFDNDWMYLKQTHSNIVVTVDDISTNAGEESDAIVTSKANLPVAVATADCAPIALSSPEGVIAAVHAGWRGMHNGVLVEAAKAMRELGATEIHAALGPCIHVECYEFDGPELDELADKLGVAVVGKTSNGVRALDMVVAAKLACEAADVSLDFVHEACTACTDKYFSWRARKTMDRQVMIVWRGDDEAEAI